MAGFMPCRGIPPARWGWRTTLAGTGNRKLVCRLSVSYTHLDVYKRQPYGVGQAQLGYLNSGVTGTGPGNFGSTENQRRNQFFGPRYFDTDMTIMKYTGIPRWEGAKVGIGAQFFNPVSYTHLDVYKRQDVGHESFNLFRL